jgi:hypothetical protein
MTNQELLAGFLDRSLSEDELLEFEARQNASPEFAAEVREMLTVEDLLTTATPRVRYPVEFLSSVEGSVAAKVAAAATATGIIAGLAKNAWMWLAGGSAAVVIGGGALYLASTNASEERPTTAAPTRTVVQPAPAPSATEMPSTPQAQRSVTPGAQRILARTSATAPASVPSSDIDLNAQKTDPSSVSKGLMAEYERCAQANDPVRCAQVALTLGRQLRKESNVAEARTYLDLALSHARTMKLGEYEMNAHGELGLLALAEGDNARAAAAFKRAVEVGQAHQKETSRWTRELEAIPTR